MKKIVITAVATIAALAGAASAGQPSIDVTYAQRDLAAGVDANTVYSSISRTARRACDLGYTNLAGRRAEAQCTAELVSKAVDRLGNYSLSAIHRADGDMVVASN